MLPAWKFLHMGGKEVARGAVISWMGEMIFPIYMVSRIQPIIILGSRHFGEREGLTFNVRVLRVRGYEPRKFYQ